MRKLKMKESPLPPFKRGARNGLAPLLKGGRGDSEMVDHEIKPNQEIIK
jgi:hypothetical protein